MQINSASSKSKTELLSETIKTFLIEKTSITEL